MSVLLLILGILLFMGLVIIHELGHFWAAKRNGVEVEEFGIGFPPRIWSKKTKGGWDFSVNWLPLGGFVKLKGESDADKAKGSLGAASTWAKTKIMLAGVGMNLLAAFLIFTVLALVGMPKLFPNQFTVQQNAKVARNDVLIGGIGHDSPASKAGLQSTDRIISVANEPVAVSTDLPAITQSHAGQEVTIKYDREGSEHEAKATLLTEQEVNDSRNTNNPKGYLGIQPYDYSVTRYTWAAPVVAAGVIKQSTEMTFKALGSALKALFQGQGGKASENLTGPLGIIVLFKQGSLIGYQFILMAVGLISLSLAIMNVLPVPALDGGRLYMVLLSRLFKKKLTQEMEERIVGASFLLLLFLIALITIVDVRRYF